MQCRCRPFFLQQVGGALRKFLDKESHLRLRGFVIRDNTVHVEAFCGAGADGTDHGGAESFVECFGIVHAVRHQKQVRDLGCIHEHHHIHMTVGQRDHPFAQRLNVLRQSPLIHRQPRDGDAPLSQRSQQLGIGSSILLDCDIHSAQRRPVFGFQRGHQGAPGKRLGRNHRDRNAQFAKCARRFWSPRRDLHRPQRVQERLAIHVRGDGLHQGFYADARGEDDQVECATEQSLGEVQNGPVGIKGDLAHGRRNQRLAAVGANQLGGFDRTARLQAQYSQPIEIRHCHRGYHRARLRCAHPVYTPSVVIQAQER